MNKHAILLCFLMGASIMLYGCQQERLPRPVPEAALTYFSFSESSSYFKRVQSYEFRMEEGEAIVFFCACNLSSSFQYRRAAKKANIVFILFSPGNFFFIVASQK